MYDTGEYDIHLDIPTDNYVVCNLYPVHLETIVDYVKQIAVKDKNTLIILLGAFQCIQERDFWILPLDEYCRSIDNPVIVFTGKLTQDSDYQKPNTKFGYKSIGLLGEQSALVSTKRKSTKKLGQRLPSSKTVQILLG
jgi:hypothetical protein